MARCTVRRGVGGVGKALHRDVFFGVSPSTLKKKNKKKCLFSFTFLDALKKEKPFSEVVSPVGLLSLSLSRPRSRFRAGNRKQRTLLREPCPRAEEPALRLGAEVARRRRQ